MIMSTFAESYEFSAKTVLPVRGEEVRSVGTALDA
jgi:hypothetical protein